MNINYPTLLIEAITDGVSGTSPNAGVSVSCIVVLLPVQYNSIKSLSFSARPIIFIVINCAEGSDALFLGLSVIREVEFGKLFPLYLIQNQESNTALIEYSSCFIGSCAEGTTVATPLIAHRPDRIRHCQPQGAWAGRIPCAASQDM